MGEGNPLKIARPMAKEVGLWSHWHLGGDDGEAGLHSLEKLTFRLMGC